MRRMMGEEKMTVLKDGQKVENHIKTDLKGSPLVHLRPICIHQVRTCGPRLVCSSFQISPYFYHHFRYTWGLQVGT